MSVFVGARRRNSGRKELGDDDFSPQLPQVTNRNTKPRGRIPASLGQASRRGGTILGAIYSTSPGADMTSFPTTQFVAPHINGVRPSAKYSNQWKKEPGRNGSRSKTQFNAVDELQAKFTPAKSSRLWERYVKKFEDKDKDLVEDWDRVIDVTLVFAALFSAMTTAFVLESAKNLQLDPSKASVSAILNLTRIVQVGSASTTSGVNQPDSITIEELEEAFEPTKATIWVNCLWFLSLGLSISVSLFAMLAKRWSYVFRVRARHFGTSYERAIKRQESWDAIRRWKMELVIEHLPTTMHISLLLFFIGLIIYLFEIHRTPMIVTAALAGLVLAIYWLLTVLPAWYSDCPMATPFTPMSGTMHFKLVHFGRSTRRWMNPRKIIAWCLQVPVRLSEIWRERKGIFDIPNFFREQIYSAQDATSSKSQLPLIKEDRELVGKLKPYSSPRERKEHQQAFRALVWMLRSSKDKDIKEVLEYATHFPEVILASYASRPKLSEAVLMLVEHMNRLQHESAEPDTEENIERCRVLCGRLVYLAKKDRQCLSGSEDLATRPHLDNIEELSELYHDLMFPDELSETLEKINKSKTPTDYICWLEAFAARQTFSDPSKGGLDMCMDLSRNILGLEDASEPLPPSPHRQSQSPTCQVHPTLWWVYLINTLGYAGPVQLPGRFKNKIITFDRVLTWNHFCDSAMRDVNAPWLTVVGISGMLGAFNHFHNHESGPVMGSNAKFFTKIIQILRSLLFTTLVTDSSDPFVGEIPVYCGTKTRLYEFDSLQYACDTLKSVSNAPVYKPLSREIASLSKDIHRLMDIRHAMRSWLDNDSDLDRVERYYKTAVADKVPSSIWLASGLLRCTSSCRLDLRRARFLGDLIPDILFSTNPSTNLGPAADQSSMTESSIPTETYINGIHHIAALVWMPFSCKSYASKLQAAVQGTKNEYVGHDDLWHLLCHAGVLRTDEKYLSLLKPQWHHSDTAPSLSQHAHSDALGCSLRIKAALVERLHSLNNSAPHSLDVLGWYTALAYHFSVLLEYWDHAKMGADDEAYVIASLIALVNTLITEIDDFDTEETQSDSGHSTKQDNDLISAARTQLKSLVKAGVLQRLAHPFSADFTFGGAANDPGKDEWYEDLAKAIDRLARRFPSEALRYEPSAKMYADLVAYYKPPSGTTPTAMHKFAEKLCGYMMEQCVRPVNWFAI